MSHGLEHNLAGQPLRKPSADLDRRMEALFDSADDEAPAPHRPAFRWWTAAGLAAAVALAAIGIVMVNNVEQPPTIIADNGHGGHGATTPVAAAKDQPYEISTVFSETTPGRLVYLNDRQPMRTLKVNAVEQRHGSIQPKTFASN